MHDSVDLLITHQRRDEHQVVLVRGKQGKLTQGNVHTLLVLSAARADADTGFVIDAEACYPVAICRLRQALQRTLRSASGKAFVERGCGKEYRLKTDLSVGITAEYATYLRQHDAALLKRLEKSDISIVSSSDPTCQECAAAA